MRCTVAGKGKTTLKGRDSGTGNLFQSKRRAGGPKPLRSSECRNPATGTPAEERTRRSRRDGQCRRRACRSGGMRLVDLAAGTGSAAPRTNADKRKAVTMLLNDIRPPCERGRHIAKCDCWGAWADREIARRAHVTHWLVGAIRKELSGSNCQIGPPRKVKRGGTVYTQRTENIGRRNGGGDRAKPP